MRRAKKSSGPTWTTACPDWEKRIVGRQSLIPFAPLFPSEAEAGLAVLDEFRVVDVVGSPKFGEVARSWVRDFCASVFGALDPETGRRLVREWFLLISKKNGKSTDAGLLMLAILVLNWRQSGEFGILAPTVEVANNAFKPAADAIRADDELGALFHVQDHIRTITHRVLKASMQVVAADSETVAGKKWIVTLVDELWLFGKRPNAGDMLREATGGLLSRPEGCVIWLSTQSNEPPVGVFKEKLEYARGVRDGRIVDPQFCPVLYEFPKAMIAAEQHLDPANFYVTNPNMGASVDEPTLVRMLAQAKEAGEHEVRGFLAKHLNVEIGLALGSSRWAGADFWQQQAAQLTLDDVISRCDVIDVGIDGGGLDDMLGLCVLGRDAHSGEWLSWHHAWLHPIALERRKSEAARYRDFEADGDLTIVERVGEDVEQVVGIVLQLDHSGRLDKIGCDRAGLDEILDALDQSGIASERIVGVSQSWPLMAAIKTCERKLAGGTLRHGGTRLMNWCVGNAKVEVKGNAMYIHKQTSGTGKIDPLMAMFDAAFLLARAPVNAVSPFLEFVSDRAQQQQGEEAAA